jgi:NTE family protein
MNGAKLVVRSNIGSAPSTAVDRAPQEVGMNVHPAEIRTKRTFARARPGTPSVKTINLALQGGGAHGAFTWGVLDRLLDEPRIAIDGISATSAGAMNAAVLAYGLTVGGREGAKQALMSFWRRVAHAAIFSPLQPSVYDRMTHNHGLENSPAYLIFDLLTRLLSPYQLNPLNHNPLRHMITQVVDFERLRDRSAVKLFLSATNVRTGKVKIFTAEEITADCVLAATCLPFLYQAVEIDGEHYWDGGYMGNPALFPLIYGCTTRDILVVHINPMERPDVPTTAREIMNRVNEISFNASLMREMRAVAYVTKLIDDGKLAQGEVKRMLVHAIAADDVMQGLSGASKLNADWDFLIHLRDIGRERTQAWIDNHFDDLGVESTIDVRGTYL